MRNMVKKRVKKKSVGYIINQIISQPTVQHPKSKSPKRDLATNSQMKRKNIATKNDFSNIC